MVSTILPNVWQLNVCSFNGNMLPKNEYFGGIPWVHFGNYACSLRTFFKGAPFLVPRLFKISPRLL